MRERERVCMCVFKGVWVHSFGNSLINWFLDLGLDLLLDFSDVLQVNCFE